MKKLLILLALSHPAYAHDGDLHDEPGLITLGQKEVVKQMACNASAEYRKAIEQVGMVCK